MITETSRSIGGQGAALALFNTELIGAVFELRYMIGAMVILTAADFWWAIRELRYRRGLALAAGDKALADKYRYRTSRAGRRTANKIVDYMTYLLVGAFVGYAITEPLDLTSHTVTAAIGLGLGCVFDLSSIVGHICAVKGIKFNPRKAFLSLLRMKSEEMAKVVEESTDISEDK